MAEFAVTLYHSRAVPTHEPFQGSCQVLLELAAKKKIKDPQSRTYPSRNPFHLPQRSRRHLLRLGTITPFSSLLLSVNHLPQSFSPKPPPPPAEVVARPSHQRPGGEVDSWRQARELGRLIVTILAAVFCVLFFPPAGYEELAARPYPSRGDGEVVLKRGGGGVRLLEGSGARRECLLQEVVLCTRLRGDGGREEVEASPGAASGGLGGRLGECVVWCCA